LFLRRLLLFFSKSLWGGFCNGFISTKYDQRVQKKKKGRQLDAEDDVLKGCNPNGSYDTVIFLEKKIDLMFNTK
jgi:hypothetical protein